MNSIFSLWSSIANFARSLNRLAAVADKVADEAERRVEIVGYTPAAPVSAMAMSGPGQAILADGVALETNGHAAEPVKAGRRK